MLTKVSVGLNGTLLTDIDSSIVLQSVEESAPTWNPTASARAHLLGQHYLTTEKRYKDVTINFALAIRDDFAHRTAVMDRIAAWAAAGGKLTLNYRNDQELRVKCITLPALTDVLKWANPYKIVFRAYDIPQWISTIPSTVSFTSALATRTLYVRGTFRRAHGLHFPSVTPRGFSSQASSFWMARHLSWTTLTMTSSGYGSSPPPVRIDPSWTSARKHPSMISGWAKARLMYLYLLPARSTGRCTHMGGGHCDAADSPLGSHDDTCRSDQSDLNGPESEDGRSEHGHHGA